MIRRPPSSPLFPYRPLFGSAHTLEEVERGHEVLDAPLAANPLPVRRYLPRRQRIRREWRVKDFRSEEHTSELPSHLNLLYRLLLAKKNNSKPSRHHSICQQS